MSEVEEMKAKLEPMGCKLEIKWFLFFKIVYKLVFYIEKNEKIYLKIIFL